MKRKHLLIAYRNFDGIVSSAILKTHFIEQNEPIQVIYNKRDIITSIQTIKRKYLKKIYTYVYMVGMNRYLTRLMLYLDLARVDIIKYTNGLYIYNDIPLTNLEEYQDIITEIYTTDSKTPIILANQLNVILPQELIEGLSRENNYGFFSAVNFLNNVYGYDARIAVRLERYLMENVIGRENIKGVPHVYELNEFALLKDDFETVKSKIREGNKILNDIEFVGDILVVNRDVFNSIISDRSLSLLMIERFPKTKLVIVRYDDERSTYIFTNLDGEHRNSQTTHICKQLMLDCRNGYTHLSYEEILHRIKHNRAWAMLFNI